MIQRVNAEVVAELQGEAVMPFNEIVRCAFESTGLTGMLVLQAEDPVAHEPYELIDLVGELISVMAPDAPGELKLYTYDALGFGCVELRNGRSIATLPASLTSAAEKLGVRLQLVPRPGRCSVLLTVPSAVAMIRRAA